MRKSGNSGAITSWGQITYAEDICSASTLLVNESLPDSVLAHKQYDIRLEAPNDFGLAWTKVIVCSAMPTSIWMSGYWTWANEATPVINGQGYLVCHWAGHMGVATYVHTFDYIDPEWPV